MKIKNRMVVVIFRRLLLIGCSMSMMLLCAGCGKDANESNLTFDEAPTVTVDTVIEDDELDDISTESDAVVDTDGGLEDAEKSTEEFELTESGKTFLNDMCYYLPEFASIDDTDEQFWEDFLFLSYTGKGPDGYEMVEIEREELDFMGMLLKVSREQVAAYVELALGTVLDCEPTIDDMVEGQTSFYYQDGFYYIGLSDFGDISFEYKDMEQLDGGTVLVEYKVTGGEESDLGTIQFELRMADNENGFIISRKERIE